MTVIGITGPTGSGKTTALAVLRRMDFEIIDCDALYYERLREDEDLRRALTEAFGPVFLPGGSLDRRALAARVFGDKRELQKLNDIVFPAMCAAVGQKVRNCSQIGVAIDAINLVESGLGKLCDWTVAVTAPAEIRLKRIMARDGLTEEQARSRIAAQKPDSWYRKHCTFLLENRAENKAAFETLMDDFFETLLLMNEEESPYGRKSVEGKTAQREEKRL